MAIDRLATAAPLSPPLLGSRPGATGPRVAVVTGSYGAGHDAVARELDRVLREVGCHVEVFDVAQLLPWRLGPILRSGYYAQMRRTPGSWGTTLRMLESGRPLHRWVTRLLGRAGRRVAASVDGFDLVVTTHPFGAQALGRARQTGRLSCPAVTYLTDASVHSLWIHPGIDLNLAIHQVAADDARSCGALATVVTPLVPEPRAGAAEPEDPLRSFGIVGRRALVTGGSLGVGDLEATCRDILASGLMTPVVLCGTDESLCRRLEGVPGVVALGWRDDVASLLTSSHCVVQNAGGFSCLEALAAGVPVITYRPIPGHGHTNSANLEKAGLVPWARTPGELAALLEAASTASRVGRLPGGAPDVVAVLGLQPAPVVAA